MSHIDPGGIVWRDEKVQNKQKAITLCLTSHSPRTQPEKRKSFILSRVDRSARALLTIVSNGQRHARL